MKIVFLSDTHAQHRKADIPDGDIFLHGGDVTSGREDQMLDFLDWFLALPHPYKVFIGGNMDRMLETEPEKYRAMLPAGAWYLENEGLEIEGLKIWGSPMIPNFVGAFNRSRGAELDAYWAQIPEGLDILLTHTPPAGILDRTSLGLSVGCAGLRARVERVKPRFHLFGHIHEAYGRKEVGSTSFINGSFVRGRFRNPNQAIVLEV